MSTPSDKPNSNAPENEIRVSAQSNVLKGVERVEEAFKKFDNVVLSGINAGISKVLLITEIIKLKVNDLHQYNFIETITREVKEENKQEEESEERPRFLTRFKVELYKTKPASAPKGSFYEAPYTAEQIQKIKDVKPPERPQTSGRGRGRGRGGPRGRGRGRGGPRGEGRGGRGRGEGRGRGGPRGRGEGRGRGGPRGRGEGRGRGRGRGEGRGEGRGRPGSRGEGRGRGRGRGEGKTERGGRGAPRGKKPETKE